MQGMRHKYWLTAQRWLINRVAGRRSSHLFYYIKFPYWLRSLTFTLFGVIRSLSQKIHILQRKFRQFAMVRFSQVLGSCQRIIHLMKYTPKSLKSVLNHTLNEEICMTVRINFPIVLFEKFCKSGLLQIGNL